MRQTMVGAVLGVLFVLSGCDSHVGAGQQWIFYSYEEEYKQAKYTVEEAISMKSINWASYTPAGATEDKTARLIVHASGKSHIIRGKQVETIWRQMKSNK